jgi:hypothetical protein
MGHTMDAGARWEDLSRDSLRPRTNDGDLGRPDRHAGRPGHPARLQIAARVERDIADIVPSDALRLP